MVNYLYVYLIDMSDLMSLIYVSLAKFLICIYIIILIMKYIYVCAIYIYIYIELYEQAIKYEKGSFITSTGALATLSGAKTGRAPRDKRVVKDETTEDELWWGK